MSLPAAWLGRFGRTNQMKNYTIRSRSRTNPVTRSLSCLVIAGVMLVVSGCRTSQESQQAQIALAAAKAEAQTESRSGAAASAPKQASQERRMQRAAKPATPAPSATQPAQAQVAAPASQPQPAPDQSEPVQSQVQTQPNAPAIAPVPATSTQATRQAAPTSQQPTEEFILREGDAVRISFPGAPNLNTVQAIRRDGVLSLPLIGEVYAAGLTPKELEARLLELYGPQLQMKEVNVALDSSAFTIYVIGAVLRPGKVVSTKPLSALEAIMEAGGFDFTRANMKNVRVIRYVDGKPQYFSVNLKKVMNGKGEEPFPIKPSDILYVPERFVWF